MIASLFFYPGLKKKWLCIPIFSNLIFLVLIGFFGLLCLIYFLAKICSVCKNFKKVEVKKSVENLNESIEQKELKQTSNKNIQTQDYGFEQWYQEQESFSLNPLGTMSS